MSPFIANGVTGFDRAPVCFVLLSGEILELRWCQVGQVLSQAQIIDEIYFNGGVRRDLIVGEQNLSSAGSSPNLSPWGTALVALICENRTAGQEMSEEPNPMEANGVIFERRTEGSHKDDDQPISTALHLPLTLKKRFLEKNIEKKFIIEMTRLL